MFFVLPACKGTEEDWQNQDPWQSWNNMCRTVDSQGATMRKSAFMTSPSSQTEAFGLETTDELGWPLGPIFGRISGQAGIYKFDKERMEQNEGRSLAKISMSSHRGSKNGDSLTLYQAESLAAEAWLTLARQGAWSPATQLLLLPDRCWRPPLRFLYEMSFYVWRVSYWEIQDQEFCWSGRCRRWSKLQLSTQCARGVRARGSRAQVHVPPAVMCRSLHLLPLLQGSCSKQWPGPLAQMGHEQHCNTHSPFRLSRPCPKPQPEKKSGCSDLRVKTSRCIALADRRHDANCLRCDWGWFPVGWSAWGHGVVVMRVHSPHWHNQACLVCNCSEWQDTTKKKSKSVPFVWAEVAVHIVSLVRGSLKWPAAEVKSTLHDKRLARSCVAIARTCSKIETPTKIWIS